MRVGDLFAGIGGFSLGLEWAGMETVWQVERDEFCQKVLAKHWPSVRRYGDIHDFIEEAELGAVKSVDLIAGGPPCQPASVAGKRQGAKDDRWLWPETLRAVAALRPAWCLFENPVGLRSMGLDDVLSDLEGLGYAAIPLGIPACAVGAPHERKRVWILASSNAAAYPGSFDVWNIRQRNGEQRDKPKSNEPRADGPQGASPYPNSLRKQQLQGRQPESREWISHSGWRKVEPTICRDSHGLPSRLHRDRIAALGNAVVPQIPYVIGRAIMEAENGHK